VLLHPSPRSLQLAARGAPDAAHRASFPTRTGGALGAADAAISHEKVVAAVDAMAAVMRDLNKKMLR
jgi:hypothetical protein